MGNECDKKEFESKSTQTFEIDVDELFIVIAGR